MRTLVAVNECVLDYHRATVRGCELLRLSPRLPEAAAVLDMVVGAHAARHAQHMAREEVFGAAEVNVRGIRFFVARAEQDFGRGDEQDLVS